MEEKLFSLENRVALITGASRGIGKAIALGFASAGAEVVVSSRKLPDLEKVAEEIRKRGRRAKAIACHTGNIEDIKNLVKQTKAEFGHIDILVNNAATNPIFGPVINCEEKAFDKIMEVNVKGYFFLAKEVAPIMMEQKKGNIINLASTAGLRPTPLLGIYSISKAGVIMLTKVLAWEWAPFNIRVNCIAPGLVQTKFSTALWANEEILKKILENVPLKRIAQPEEIVGAAIYLASDASSYVTGETIVVAGGSS